MPIQEIGPIKREFKPGMENVIAGVIIGLLMMVGGAALTYFATRGVLDSGGNLPLTAEKGWAWATVGLVGALGLGLLIVGFLIVRGMRSMVALRVRVGQHGFSITEKGKTQAVGWDDVVSVRETHTYERAPLLKGVAKYALPQVMSKSYLLTIEDREPFAINATLIKGHSKLAQMIREETDKRGVPWEVVEERE